MNCQGLICFDIECTCEENKAIAIFKKDMKIAGLEIVDYMGIPAVEFDVSKLKNLLTSNLIRMSYKMPPLYILK